MAGRGIDTVWYDIESIQLGAVRMQRYEERTRELYTYSNMDYTISPSFFRCTG